MRVALLTTSYPEVPDDAAGHFVRAEARALARAGHEVHVVASAPWAGDEGVRVHPCGGRSLFGWPGAAARAVEQPARLVVAAPFAVRAVAALRAIAPGRVVAHWAVPCGWPLAVAAGRPLTLVSHGADVRLLAAMPRPARSRLVRTLLDRLDPGVTDAWRFVATATREALLGSLPTELADEVARRSTIEPPRVDVDARRSSPYRWPSPGRRALVAARLVPSKRVELAIGAIAASPGWTLVVAGEGPERARLEAMAEREAPGRVVFAGLLPRPEVLGLMAGADVLLHPSSTEAAPTTVREALSLGVPVVACDAGDLARWAASEPGLCVVEATVAALASALLLASAPGPARSSSPAR